MELRFDGVSKQYKKMKALDNFTAVMTPGIYGLLGPNGAGKSTMMKILAGNLKPTEGNVTFAGHDVVEMGNNYRRMLGYMPQQQSIYPFFTGRQFMNYMGALKGIDKKTLDKQIEELADQVNLKAVIDRKVGSYSGGMKQRLLIAQAFLGRPDIVIFDEPTAGLDPKERIRMRNLIAENSSQKIILIATHVVQDIEYIANEIILLNNGRLVDMQPPEILIERMNGRVWEMNVPSSEVEQYMSGGLVSSAARHGDDTLIRFIADKAPDGAYSVVPDLEDVYLDIFGD